MRGRPIMASSGRFQELVDLPRGMPLVRAWAAIGGSHFTISGTYHSCKWSCKICKALNNMQTKMRAHSPHKISFLIFPDQSSITATGVWQQLDRGGSHWGLALDDSTVILQPGVSWNSKVPPVTSKLTKTKVPPSWNEGSNFSSAFCIPNFSLLPWSHCQS